MLHPGKKLFCRDRVGGPPDEKGRAILSEQKKQRPGKYVPGRVLISKP